MKLHRLRCAASALAVASATIWATACPGPTSTATPTPTPSGAARPECPYDSVLVQVFEHGEVVKTISNIPLSGPISQIPEFHDCQRFVHGNQFGALYAIFASFRLESLFADLKRADSQAIANGEGFGSVPVGTIYSYNGNYSQLGIRPGFNCLFVFRETGKWNARMVPWGDSEDCTDGSRSLSDPSAKTLQVRPSGVAGIGDDDYPPVARWDWDSVRRQQYIGIKCGPAWCEVGNPGFTPSPAYSGPIPSFDPVTCVSAATAIEAVRVTRVKGWYDSQRLAVVSGSATVPGGVWGYFIPSPALNRIDQVSCFLNNWVHTAVVVVDDNYKFGFESGVNKISTCHGPAQPATTGGDACNVPSPPPCPADIDGLPWWAMTESPTGAKTYRCVKRRDHAAELTALNLQIPGTVRWRWLSSDETNWMRCSTGCCEIK